jgi:HK97 family phage portal protein
MRVLGFDITLTKAPAPSDLRPAPSVRDAAWHRWSFGGIRESFTGAWQRNIEIDCSENLLKFSAVYACVDLIASDISKLRIKLVERQQDDIWRETTSSAFSPVLRKPNRFQTRIQFISQWITSKLLWGNAYVLKERDARNVVTAMFVLDPSRVTPMVTPEGAVWYRLRTDWLAQLPGNDNELMVPASEIIHDRMVTLFHPLVGVSPIYACGASATQGARIQNNSAVFFANQSTPSGVLSYPGELDDTLAEAYRQKWQNNFSGGRIGGVAVISGGFSYAPITIPAQDAQLIEQLRWTVEDVARTFHVPAHKLGLGQPTLNNIAALNQDYYNQCLQTLIESVEILLDEGLATPPDMGTEFDLDNLLRMDPVSLADVNEKGIRAGYLAPNEARLRSNLEPVEGGDSPYMQQQNWSLEALSQRPPAGQAPVPATTLPAPEPPPPAPAPEKAMNAFAAAVTQRFRAACGQLAA